MILNLSSPPQQYSRSDEAQARSLMQQADRDNVKKGSVQDSFIMQSPNGSKFAVSVSNGGALVVTSL